LTSGAKSLLIVSLLWLTLSLVLPSVPVAAYAPHQGDYFSYHEVQNLANGTGSYAGYSEAETVTGTERVTGVSERIVSANYSYSYTWSNSTGSTETGSKSGNYTFSSETFLYVQGTDDQVGYVNPTVWFCMNSSTPAGGTFELLNTPMTVLSRNYSFYLPSENRYVSTLHAQGISSYHRDDTYGMFSAAYTWNAYFDPSSGYIVGYNYVEHDTNSSGNGFTFTDNLYVTSSSYPLAAGAAPPSVVVSTNQALQVTNGLDYTSYVIIAVLVLILLGILAYLLSRRSRRSNLPKHSVPPPPASPPTIDLAPREQPPVQQIVIKEVVKVPCKYCGTLIDSTAEVCPRCGAPRA
jgi:hypothetical protein